MASASAGGRTAHATCSHLAAASPSSDQWIGSARSRWCRKLIHGCVRRYSRSLFMDSLWLGASIGGNEGT